MPTNGNPWILSTDEPHGGHVYLANGYMSAALGFDANLLLEAEAPSNYVRGVYNDSGSGGIDRLVNVPAWGWLRYGAPATVEGYSRQLDLRPGSLRTVLDLREARGVVHVAHTIFVSRADRHLAVIELTLRPEFDGELVVITGLERRARDDMQIVEVGADTSKVWLKGISPHYAITVAEALHFVAAGWTFDDSTGNAAVNRVARRGVESGETVRLILYARLATSLDSDQPLELVREYAGDLEEVRRAHEAAMDALWQVDIEIAGDDEAQRYVRAALFYLWSNILPDDAWSIAPMGISSNGYNGHFFWDAELWMYPALLLTHPAMARSCMTYRQRTIGPARARAEASGQRGARYPWEAAFTGEEMTPVWAATRDYQLHITADVAIAQWWHYLNTGDREWLRDDAYPVLRACAEYWASRVELRGGRYDISNVVCADEYAEHVDNDAFTNAAAALCLRVANRASEVLGLPTRPEWIEIADRIYIPYDEQRQIHLEYDTYAGQVTKQADVELLTYPLEFVTDPAQVRRDLDFYRTVIDPNGPAMSFSVYAIISAQLNRMQDALAYFRRSYRPNTRPPFFAFSETPTNNEFLFCTGIGGSLQVPLFGFSGIRLYESYFALSPHLPDEWSRLRLHNLYLAGARTTLEIEHDRSIVQRNGVALEFADETVRADAPRGATLRVETPDGTVLHDAPVSPDMRVGATAPVRVQVSDTGGEMLVDVLFR